MKTIATNTCVEIALRERADPRGRLEVNESFQTAVPHIYAAGDVIGFPALASTSMEQGLLASCHMFGRGAGKIVAELLPYGIYTIPEISMVGKTERQLTELKIPYEAGTAKYEEVSRGRSSAIRAGSSRSSSTAIPWRCWACTPWATAQPS